MAARRVEGIESAWLGRVEEEQLRAGFRPTRISLCRDGERVLATVEFDPQSVAGETRILRPRPFRDGAGRAFWETLEPDALDRVLVSLGATTDDAETASATGGLVIAGVLAPQPARRVAWSVHVDEVASREAWESLEEVALLRAISWSRDVIFLDATAGGLPRVVSLWTDTTGPRIEVVAEGRGVAAEASGHPRGPLDRFMFQLLDETAATVGQLVVVRDGLVTFAKAYGSVPPDAAPPSLAQKLRIGSLSKSLTVMALHRALSARGLDTDAAIAEPLASLLAGPRGPLRYRDLVEHRAGFPSFQDIRHDDPSNPLSERAISRLLYGDERAPQPGDLVRALRRERTRPSWLGPAQRMVYSNEGYVLLGELLSELVTGDPSNFERLLGETLFGDASVSLALAPGRDEAGRRAEAVALASVPTWARDRFSGAGAGPTTPPYLYNGPFLAPAAGVCASLAALAPVLARALPRSVSMDAAAATRALSVVHGLYSGDRGWWSTKCKGRPSRSTPFARFHHNGRVEGGSSMLVHQCPIGDEDGPAITVLVAFNRLGALSYDPHGRAVFDILKSLEASRIEA